VKPRGLVDTDTSLDKCLEEAAKWQMHYSLRRLLAIIMVFCESVNISFLWDKHFVSLSEDYRRTIVNDKVVQQMVLRDINDMIGVMGKDIRTYGLPDLDEQDDETGYYNREVREQYAFGVHGEDLKILIRSNFQVLKKLLTM
jgi:hypothetical protein